MKLVLNIAISTVLLAAVFFVANQGMSFVNASTVQMPGMMLDGFAGGHLKLHGFGFRPGSLVNVELKPREGGHVITGVNAWVDAKGSFTADFDLTRVGIEVANVDGESNVNWNDWMVYATASTGTYSVPLHVSQSPQE